MLDQAYVSEKTLSYQTDDILRLTIKNNCGITLKKLQVTHPE
jgi:hypothetical protein